MLELQRRNSLLPVALRSVYPVEFQVCSRNISEEKLKFADPNELKISMPPPPAPKSPNSTPVAKHQPEEVGIHLKHRVVVCL